MITVERVAHDLSTTTGYSYTVRGVVTPEAITRSLQAVLPTRHHRIARHRFTLLDTFDGRIRRAGARLTCNNIDGTLAVAWESHSGGSPLSAPLRQPVSFAWDLPEGPLQQALTPVIGVRRLLPQADAEEYGSLLEVLDGQRKTVARLRIESGRARLPMGRSDWLSLPTMVTLTGLRGYKDEFDRLVPLIESRPGIESRPDGLQEVILRLVGAPVTGDIATARSNLATTVMADSGARQIHLGLVDVLELNEPGLRANLDTEFLHDFRVTLRRMRSLLGQIRHIFPPEAVEHFATELAWVGRLTSRPRDVDVLALTLRERRREIGAGETEVLEAFLGEAQEQEHRRLVEALDSERYARLIADWKTFLERPAPRHPAARNAGRLLADVVGRRAWRLSRRLAESAENIDRHTLATRLHEIRINAKKLRYLIDATPAFYDPADLERLLGALKKLQRVLGDFNDAYVQEERLIEYGLALGAANAPPGVLLTLGRLAEQSRRRRDDLRGPIREGLARFKAPATRSACRRAFKSTRATESVQ